MQRSGGTHARGNGFGVAIILLLILVYMAYQGVEPQLTHAQAKSKQQTGKTTQPSSSHTQPQALAIPDSKHINPKRPVLAFYYAWYNKNDWCQCHMPDLPSSLYTSSDPTTINHQVYTAASAGITGFISSWWGMGDQTDQNFAQVLRSSAALKQQSGYPFASSIYFEGDSPHLQSTTAIVNSLRYLLQHYGNNPYFFHWQGKPVLFFWKPLDGGRTLALWRSIRRQVDPHNQTIWSAEGVDMNLLSVFDGIHLFSAGYWGLLNGDMALVNQQFHNNISVYNNTHHTQKIWAAGVMPGYDDTRVPGRKGTFKVPRDNGATYAASWNAALSSSPNWVTITSFNEWFEGAMIEPSTTYGNQYLLLTRHYSLLWHG